MKIRFNMEVKGCQWMENHRLKSCPHFKALYINGPCCNHHGHLDAEYRPLPESLNPSWCPMMKKVA